MMTITLLRNSDGAITLEAGQIIFEKDRSSDMMYAVLEGEVDILLNGKLVDTAGPGVLICIRDGASVFAVQGRDAQAGEVFIRKARRAMNKARVLFLCTGNSARSQMAEALLRKYAGDTFEVHSAGLEPKGINPYTLRVMEEIGLDLSGHRSKDVMEYMGRLHFGYAITVCDNAEQNCPIFPFSTVRLHWSFEDPAHFEGTDSARLARFREVRDRIDARLRAWLAEQGIPVDQAATPAV